MAHPLLQEVRLRFGGACGYCGVSEVDCGGELTVDHFQPSSAQGPDDLDNLVYACARCNTYKGKHVANESDLAQGRRLLHPMRDDLRLHLRLDPDNGLVEARTPTGQFHIDLLHLNRLPLVKHRLRKRYWDLLRSHQRLLEQENEQLEDLCRAQDRLLRRLAQDKAT